MYFFTVGYNHSLKICSTEKFSDYYITKSLEKQRVFRSTAFIQMDLYMFLPPHSVLFTRDLIL